VGLPIATPKPVVGLPNRLSARRPTKGLDYLKENYGLMAMMLLTIRALSPMKE